MEEFNHVLFIHCLQEVEYKYKRIYKVKKRHFSTHRNAKVVPVVVTPSKGNFGGAAEELVEHGEHQAPATEEKEMEHLENRKSASQWHLTAAMEEEAASFWKRLYDDIFEPYEYVLELDNEPMPLWLRFMVNVTRPITALKYGFKYYNKDGEMLPYDYNSAVFAMNALFRVMAVIGLVVIIVVFFGTYGITLQD